MEVDEKLYFQLRDTMEVFSRLNNRLDVTGTENIPLHGGAILCPNHANYSDPFFVGAAVKSRLLHFLAWHGIGEMPLVGPIFKRLGTMHSITESYGVATDKEEAREVMGELEQLLRNGELVVIFPEGTIKHWISKGGIDEFKPGALRLAAKAGVPIIPAGLTGTRWVVANIINFHDFGGPDKGFWLPTALPVKVRVKFGQPFTVDPAAAEDRSAAEREAARLRETIIELIDSMKPASLLGHIF